MTEAIPTRRPAPPPRRREQHPWLVLGLALLAFVWTANSSGLISSNDGSHLALARALVLRGETSIDPDRALTLEVDLAERDGRAYSDRPPGTAFAALPATWLGDRLDPRLFERAMAQARAGLEVDPLPGAQPYIATYAARSAAGSTGPPLAKLIGSSIAISIHAVLIGLLGLVLIERLLRRMPELDWGARTFALACLGLASAFGPYSTTLFAHGSAATAVAGCLLGAIELGREGDRSTRTAMLTGLAGAWAIACDYLLLLAIVPVILALVPKRQWAVVGLGAAPIVLATFAYHTAAFGSPLAVGYDHQSNFAFARERGSTFSGNLMAGLWTLWGLGRGAGLLAQAPIVLVGIAALLGWGLRARHRNHCGGDLARSARALLCFVPWVLVLALHRTPWGGGTEDHRYLIPILPFAAIGLALAWARAKPILRAAAIVLALVSAVLIWRHFLAWHQADPFARLGLAALVAGPIALVGVGQYVRSRLKSAKP